MPVPASGLPFRANVAVLLRLGDSDRFVACERSTGEGWQCVQGGVEPSDVSMEDALLREVREELGIDPGSVTIERRSRAWRRYRFPPEMLAEKSEKREGNKDPGDKSAPRDKHQGQEQLWFVARIPSLGCVRLELSQGEFRAVKELTAAELVEAFVHWKRPVVTDFFREIGLLPAT